MSNDSDPAIGAIAVTPSDSTDISTTKAIRGLWVGGTGNLNVNFSDGTNAVITAVPTGTLLPMRVKRVLSTSTTATSILALY